MAPLCERILGTIIEAMSGSVSTNELCINCINVSFYDHYPRKIEGTNILMGFWQSIVGFAVGTHLQ